MKQLFLSLCLVSSFLGASDQIVGWQEFPRTTMTEKCIVTVMQSLSASIGFYAMGKYDKNIKVPGWMHAVSPTVGACALGPTLVRGWRFKSKIAASKIPKMYDPQNLTDPLLYVNTIAHPFNPDVLIISGAGLWKAFQAVDAEQQVVFAKTLLKNFDYDSVEWALRSVREAKKQIEQALHDIKKYSDIEDRLNRIIDFQQHKAITRTEHMLGVEPEELEGFVQQILDSGTYCQQVTINSITREVTTQDLSQTWHEDDFVYYYASWYAFELLKSYSRLLAFEKIVLSIPS